MPMMPPHHPYHYPHMGGQPLSVHCTGSNKSKGAYNGLRRSIDKQRSSIERHQSNGAAHRSGSTGRKAAVEAHKKAQLNPRQLNFNDESMESDHRIRFEEVDQSSNVQTETRKADQNRFEAGQEEDCIDSGNRRQRVADEGVIDAENENEDRLEVVKIKLNKSQYDQKSPGRVDSSLPRDSLPQTARQSSGSRKLRFSRLTVGPLEEESLQEASDLACTKPTPKNGMFIEERRRLDSVSNHMLEFSHQDTPRNHNGQYLRTHQSKGQIAYYNDPSASLPQSSPYQRPRVSQSDAARSLARIKEGSGLPDQSLLSAPDGKKGEAQDRDQSYQVDVTPSAGVTIKSAASSVPHTKRRGYMYNEVSGQMERVIRKRKRKTAMQLEELALAFDSNPHWTKETLLNIATKTNLTEAQVYKWGWDQKRKKFGVVEAERMRQYENILDQQAAQKQAAYLNKQHDSFNQTLVQKRQPEITPENMSNEAAAFEDIRENSKPNKILSGAPTPKDYDLTPQVSDLKPDRARPALNASAEPNFLTKNCDGDKSRAQVSEFTTVVDDKAQHQAMTVKKPGNGVKDENLQKSATTNSNTIKVSYNGPQFTPKDKLPKAYDTGDFSDKFTPECSAAHFDQLKQDKVIGSTSSKLVMIESQSTAAVPLSTIQQRRNQKQAAKEQQKIRLINLSNESSQKEVASSNVMDSQDATKQLQLTASDSTMTLAPRRTRQSKPVAALGNKEVDGAPSASSASVPAMQTRRSSADNQASSQAQVAAAPQRRSKRSLRSKTASSLAASAERADE